MEFLTNLEYYYVSSSAIMCVFMCVKSYVLNFVGYPQVKFKKKWYHCAYKPLEWPRNFSHSVPKLHPKSTVLKLNDAQTF